MEFININSLTSPATMQGIVSISFASFATTAPDCETLNENRYPYQPATKPSNGYLSATLTILCAYNSFLTVLGNVMTVGGALTGNKILLKPIARLGLINPSGGGNNIKKLRIDLKQNAITPTKRIEKFIISPHYDFEWDNDYWTTSVAAADTLTFRLGSDPNSNTVPFVQTSMGVFAVYVFP